MKTSYRREQHHDTARPDAEASGDLLEKAYVYLTEGRYPAAQATTRERFAERLPSLQCAIGEILYKKSVRGLEGKKVEQSYIQVHSLFIEITSSTADRCADAVHQNQGGAVTNPACMSLTQHLAI